MLTIVLYVSYLDGYPTRLQGVSVSLWDDPEATQTKTQSGLIVPPVNVHVKESEEGSSEDLTSCSKPLISSVCRSKMWSLGCLNV